MIVNGCRQIINQYGFLVKTCGTANSVRSSRASFGGKIFHIGVELLAHRGRAHRAPRQTLGVRAKPYCACPEFSRLGDPS
jgi:hypothetical protein